MYIGSTLWRTVPDEYKELTSTLKKLLPFHSTITRRWIFPIAGVYFRTYIGWLSENAPKKRKKLKIPETCDENKDICKHQWYPTSWTYLRRVFPPWTLMAYLQDSTSWTWTRLVRRLPHPDEEWMARWPRLCWAVSVTPIKVNRESYTRVPPHQV